MRGVKGPVLLPPSANASPYSHTTSTSNADAKENISCRTPYSSISLPTPAPNPNTNSNPEPNPIGRQRPRLQQMISKHSWPRLSPLHFQSIPSRTLPLSLTLTLSLTLLEAASAREWSCRELQDAKKTMDTVVKAKDEALAEVTKLQAQVEQCKMEILTAQTDGATAKVLTQERNLHCVTPVLSTY